MWNKYKGLIFVISGPSGSGKTTLLKELLKDKNLKNKLTRSISFTTRKPRPGERQGQDYFFISKDIFKKKRNAKKLLEWTRYLGYYYATSKEYLAEALAKGKNIALCLDLKGALKIRQLFGDNACLIFIVPPSIATLRTRIEGRCRKTDGRELFRRLRLAKTELAAAKRYDYCIVNKNLTVAKRKLKIIVMRHIAKVTLHSEIKGDQ